MTSTNKDASQLIHQSLEVAHNAVLEFFKPLTTLYALLSSDIVSKASRLDAVLQENRELKNKLKSGTDPCIQVHPGEGPNTSKPASRHLLQLYTQHFSNPVVHSLVRDAARTLIPLRLPKKFPQMAMTASEIGIAKIEFLVTEIKRVEKVEPVLFGINKSGAFLASYIANRLNFDQKNLSRCDLSQYNKVICRTREIPDNTSIVIIDDISRSGKTFLKIKKYLNGRFPGSKLYSMTLVCVENPPSTPATYVDYSPWLTHNEELQFPWSAESENTICNFHIEDDDVNQLFESYRLSSDFADR